LQSLTQATPPRQLRLCSGGTHSAKALAPFKVATCSLHRQGLHMLVARYFCQENTRAFHW